MSSRILRVVTGERDTGGVIVSDDLAPVVDMGGGSHVTKCGVRLMPRNRRRLAMLVDRAGAQLPLISSYLGAVH